jgi:hypothetical protein
MSIGRMCASEHRFRRLEAENAALEVLVGQLLKAALPVPVCVPVDLEGDSPYGPAPLTWLDIADAASPLWNAMEDKMVATVWKGSWAGYSFGRVSYRVGEELAEHRVAAGRFLADPTEANRSALMGEPIDVANTCMMKWTRLRAGVPPE